MWHHVLASDIDNDILHRASSHASCVFTSHMLIASVPHLASQVRLNLEKAGLEWDGPKARKTRSGAPLVEAMIASEAACSDLHRLIISAASGYEIPVSCLRNGGAEALAALRGARLLADGGPRRIELLLMSDLLRKNRRTGAAAAKEVESSANAVASLIEAAKRGEVSVEEWELRVTEMMVGGETRRAHFATLISAPVLRDVGFGASALIVIGFTPEELKQGGYPAYDLRTAGGLSYAALHELGCSLLRGFERTAQRASHGTLGLAWVHVPHTQHVEAIAPRLWGSVCASTYAPMPMQLAVTSPRAHFRGHIP